MEHIYEYITIPYQKGELKTVGYKSGKIAAQDSQFTAQSPKILELNSIYPSLKSGGYDIAIVNIQFLDTLGNTILDADDLVNFEVQNRIILGVGNGNPNSHEPDVAPYRKLFHGKAQLILKTIGNKTVYIKAYTESGYQRTCIIQWATTARIIW